MDKFQKAINDGDWQTAAKLAAGNQYMIDELWYVIYNEIYNEAEMQSARVTQTGKEREHAGKS